MRVTIQVVGFTVSVTGLRVTVQDVAALGTPPDSLRGRDSTASSEPHGMAQPPILGMTREFSFPGVYGE